MNPIPIHNCCLCDFRCLFLRNIYMKLYVSQNWFNSNESLNPHVNIILARMANPKVPDSFTLNPEVLVSLPGPTPIEVPIYLPDPIPKFTVIPVFFTWPNFKVPVFFRSNPKVPFCLPGWIHKCHFPIPKDLRISWPIFYFSRLALRAKGLK